MGSIFDMAMSPDGRMLASGSMSTLNLQYLTHVFKQVKMARSFFGILELAR
jgi:hypothetical protein